jgi:hypothetical protein
VTVEDHRHPRFRAAEAGRSIDDLKIYDLRGGDVTAAGDAVEQLSKATVTHVTGVVEGSAGFTDPASRTLSYSTTGISAGGGTVSVDSGTRGVHFHPDRPPACGSHWVDHRHLHHHRLQRSEQHRRGGDSGGGTRVVTIAATATCCGRLPPIR